MGIDIERMITKFIKSKPEEVTVKTLFKAMIAAIFIGAFIGGCINVCSY